MINNVFDFQSLLGGKISQEKVFEIIDNRFIEYKEAYKKSSPELMDEATEQLVQYGVQGFIKMDNIYNTVINYADVIQLKKLGETLEEDEKEINKEINLLIKTICDTIPHDKENHIEFSEFVKRIFNRIADGVQQYLAEEEIDEDEVEEEDDEKEKEEDKHNKKKRPDLGGLANVKLGSPIQS